MRQVPLSQLRPVGVIGNGRLARHLLYYFNLLGIPVRTWSRSAPTTDPACAVADCSTVLLLIQDAAIESFVEAHPALRRKRLVHCSGALVTSVAEAAHPLMTFGTDLYDEDVYRRIPFILDSSGTPFDELLPGLPNPSFSIRREDRPYYHALCVIAGNMSVLLWTKLFRELQSRFGIPASAAAPYLEQTTANLLRDPDHALTGPLARGDVGTIHANLRALDGDPFQAVYAACARAYEQRA